MGETLKGAATDDTKETGKLNQFMGLKKAVEKTSDELLQAAESLRSELDTCDPDSSIVVFAKKDSKAVDTLLLSHFIGSRGSTLETDDTLVVEAPRHQFSSFVVAGELPDLHIDLYIPNDDPRNTSPVHNFLVSLPLGHPDLELLIQ